MRNLALLLPLILSCASCRVREDSASAMASEAGQSTIVLGGCQSEFNLGWTQCLIEKGAASYPILKFIMTNPGEWAVSDCGGGIFKAGAQSGASLVEVDLNGLQSQAERAGFCILKIETIEKFKDPNGSSSYKNLYMRGGFFIETVTPGYFPVPSKPDIAFCVKVQRTTKGRTKIEKCSP